MTLTPVQLVSILATTAGFFAFFAAYRLVIVGVDAYERRFVARIGRTLRDAFVYLDPKALFFVNLGLIALCAIIGFVFAGIYGMFLLAVPAGLVPRFVTGILRRRRTKRFIEQLPDTLGGIAAALRAGSTFTRAIEQIASRNQPPVSQEFSAVLSDYRLGRSLEAALAGVRRRVGTREVDLMISAVLISRDVGGNLAATLDSLASATREKSKVEGKIDALTSMGRLQSWVMCLLPVALGIAVFRQDPERMLTLVREPTGWIVLGICGLLMLAAIIVIRKIVRIDV